MEYTIFFNANAQPLFNEKLGQRTLDVEGMVESLPGGDVVAEVFLTDFNEVSGTAQATASVVRVIKTTDTRVRQGEEVSMKFKLTSCGPNHGKGSKGTIVAIVVGTDIKGRPVLCPYSRRFKDGRINLRC